MRWRAEIWGKASSGDRGHVDSISDLGRMHVASLGLQEHRQPGTATAGYGYALKALSHYWIAARALKLSYHKRMSR